MFNAEDPRCESCLGLTEERKSVPADGAEYQGILRRHNRLQSPCPSNCSRRLAQIFGKDKLRAKINGTYTDPDTSAIVATYSHVAFEQ